MWRHAVSSFTERRTRLAKNRTTLPAAQPPRVPPQRPSALMRDHSIAFDTVVICIACMQ